MSQSLLKKCLQLVEDDLPVGSKKAKRYMKNKQKKSSIFDMIPEQKRLTITMKAGKNQAKRKSKAFHIVYGKSRK